MTVMLIGVIGDNVVTKIELYVFIFFSTPLRSGMKFFY